MPTTRPTFRLCSYARAAAVLVMTAAAGAVGTAPAGAIVGGNPTTPAQYPYFVKLVFGAFQCGGSVIDPEWVLTAAHCAAHVNGDADLISVYLRDTDFTVATDVVVHPLWNGHEEDGHDLALVRVPSSATAGITPVQVGAPFDPGAYAAGVEATVVGHGYRDPAGPGTEQLFDLHTPLQSDDYMDAIYNPWYWFDDWTSALMIGAGWTNHTVCHGDSGDPLTVQRNGVTVQVGVASFVQTWPHECGEPGGYAELHGAQLAWVESHVPSLWARWGVCIAADGQVGHPYVSYYLGSGAPYYDGPYNWNLMCASPTPIPPQDPPEGPNPAICKKKPWLCEE